MSAIGPGDWVECVDDAPDHKYGLPFPVAKGSIHRVREVCGHGESIRPRHRSMNGSGALTLEGIRARHPAGVGDDWPMGIARFRPIYRPKADLIESLKTPAKREGVPA